MDKKDRAFIAMSGGVDSSVAALLTLEQGWAAVGGTLRLYEGTPGACGSARDVEDARAVAQRLGIGFQVIDATGPFRRQVLEKFVRAYAAGDTPSPCIDCNRYMKFGLLLERALDMGCSHIVTGHYAQIRRDEATGRYLLCKASDLAKDQSYFLCMLTQEQLAHVLFPLGGLTKAQVRSIAQERGFLNARKRDSQDICFVPDGNYKAFLERCTGNTYPAGDLLDLSGQVVGRHSGAIGYTQGQRKGLGVALGKPVYVCRKDMARNTVTVGPNEALFHRSFLADDWNFFPFPALTRPMEVHARIRSRMTEQPATVYPAADGMVRVVFHQPQRAIAPGQAVVLYQADVVIGGGRIREVLED